MKIEEWRAVVGYEGWYKVSDRGRVKRVARGHTTRPGKMLTLCSDNEGYAVVTLYGPPHRSRRLVKVHRLVLTAFRGPCPAGCQTRHLDGSKANNGLANLAWGSARENQHDRKIHGTSSAGERNPAAKLKESDVREIRRIAAMGWACGKIGYVFGVRGCTIARIVCRDTWKHVA